MAARLKRRRLTEREVIDVLIAQGVVIRCPRSGVIIERGADAIREHLHQLGLDGTDTLDNMQFWHKDASHTKSYGTKATSAGSDANVRAKLRRAAKRRSGKAKPKRKIPSRPFPKRK